MVARTAAYTPRNLCWVILPFVLMLPVRAWCPVLSRSLFHRRDGLSAPRRRTSAAPRRRPFAVRALAEASDRGGMEGIEAHQKAMKNFQLDILYEDAEIVVVNKPVNALCVPGRYIKDSLVVRVAQHFGIEDYARTVVHRLDQHTSGVIVFARTEEALKHLHEQLRNKSMRKQYVALVKGNDILPTKGKINLPIRKDMDNAPKQMVDFELGKPSLTEYHVRKAGHDRSLVELRPVTGRTHQLRVHLASIGHPILGDLFYAPYSVQALSPNRLCLHAESLSFRHPSTKEVMTFSCAYPSEWDEGLLDIDR